MSGKSKAVERLADKIESSNFTFCVHIEHPFRIVNRQVTHMQARFCGMRTSA